MNKRTLAKFGGFAIAAATTAALVGFAANGTGAYFTASSDGHANVSTGAVTVNTAGINGIDFTGLLPGNYKTQTISYNVSGGTSSEDVYLELPADPALMGAPTPGPNPLGRYGHFAVSGPDGSFSSFNLAGTPQAAGNCPTDQYGRGGGETTPATSTLDFSVAECPAPQFILLSYGMNPSDPTVNATITFGFTPLLTGPQSSPVTSMPVRVVAVQHGVLPNDPNNAPFV